MMQTTMNRPVSLSAPIPAEIETLLSRGYYLHPLHHPVAFNECSCQSSSCKSVGKHPRLSDWELNASNHLNRIQSWAKRFPLCNWGIATGPSNLIVIDEDKPGEFERFTEDQGQSFLSVHPSLIVSTGRPGCFHYYFRTHASMKVKMKSGDFKAIGYQLDFKSSGGQVVAPGSVHRSGLVYTIVGSS